MADTSTIATDGFFDPYDDGLADTTSVATYGVWDSDSPDPTSPWNTAAPTAAAAMVILFP